MKAQPHAKFPGTIKTRLDIMKNALKRNREINTMTVPISTPTLFPSPFRESGNRNISQFYLK